MAGGTGAILVFSFLKKAVERANFVSCMQRRTKNCPSLTLPVSPSVSWAFPPVQGRPKCWYVKRGEERGGEERREEKIKFPEGG
jgi:hypothetical protein